MRLVADIGKEQQLSGERLKEIENLTRERDIATQKQRESELELQQVKDNLKHSQEAWSSTRERLADQELKYAPLCFYQFVFLLSLLFWGGRGGV